MTNKVIRILSGLNPEVESQGRTDNWTRRMKQKRDKSNQPQPPIFENHRMTCLVSTRQTNSHYNWDSNLLMKSTTIMTQMSWFTRPSSIPLVSRTSRAGRMRLSPRLCSKFHLTHMISSRAKTTTHITPLPQTHSMSRCLKLQIQWGSQVYLLKVCTVPTRKACMTNQPTSSQ